LENEGKQSLVGLTLGVNVANHLGAKHKFTGMHSLATPKNRGVYSGHFPPPSRGGKKIGTFGTLGKKIDPSEKKFQL